MLNYQRVEDSPVAANHGGGPVVPRWLFLVLWLGPPACRDGVVGRVRKNSLGIGWLWWSMDWFKGQFTGNHRFSHEIWGFPVDFSLNQSIDDGNILPTILSWYLLVGGFKHVLFSISYMGCHPSRWLIYLRGVETTNQYLDVRIFRSIWVY